MMKNLIESILNESQLSPLYHGTSIDGIGNILDSNTLKQSDEFQRISFSRDFSYAMQWGNGIVIAFDQVALKRKFGKKLQPSHYWEAEDLDEKEEALFGVDSIKNLKSYILGIYLRKSQMTHHVKLLKILQRNDMEFMLNMTDIVPKNWFKKYIGEMS